MEEFLKFLHENNFYLDDQTIKLIFSKLLSSRKMFMLRGPAGVGKTQLTYLIARYLDAKYVFYQCTYGSSEDDLLYKYIPSEQAKSGIKVTLGPIPLALQLSKTQKVVLCLDEFDKTRPSADALLLDVLQNFRVSLYLDDDQRVIEGNPENLIIFLTSNDVREFSEPLLRRLTVIYLNPLPSDKVYSLLSSRFRFSNEVSLLLTQIYDDTVNACLRKPATIQELVELGEILQNNLNLDLGFLLRSIVIKYDDDWDRYLQYVKFRKPYKFIQSSQNNFESVTEYYKPDEEIILQDQQSNNSNNNSNLNQVIEKIRSKFKVPVPSVDFAAEQVVEQKEVYMLVEDNDKDAYTAVIKKFMPNPTDRPDEFDKFKVYFDDQKVFITSKDPLSIDELLKLRSTDLQGEFYAEEAFTFISSEIYKYLVEKATKVEYYTKNLLRISVAQKDTISVIELEVLKDRGGYLDIVLRLYIKGKIYDALIVDPKEFRRFKSGKEYDNYFTYDVPKIARELATLIRQGINAELKIRCDKFAYNDKLRLRCVLDDSARPNNVNIILECHESFANEKFGINEKEKLITDKNVILQILDVISNFPR